MVFMKTERWKNFFYISMKDNEIACEIEKLPLSVLNAHQIIYQNHEEEGL